MHVVNWAKVQILISFDWSLFCFCSVTWTNATFVFFIAATAIKPPISKTHALVSQIFNNRIVGIEHHCFDKCVTRSLEKAAIEISIVTPIEKKGERLLWQVCINQHQNKCCIEKLTVKSNSRDTFELFSLCHVTDPSHSNDDHRADYVIKTCKNVRNTIWKCRRFRWQF